jgi:hypothetical protein
VLSKSFPENSIFAKVYIRQQYQTFFSNIRRKCTVQNQTYSFAKFNSAKTLFYVLSIVFFQKIVVFAKVYIHRKYKIFFNNIRRNCTVQNQKYFVRSQSFSQILFHVRSSKSAEKYYFLRKFNLAKNTSYFHQHQKNNNKF